MMRLAVVLALVATAFSQQFGFNPQAGFGAGAQNGYYGQRFGGFNGYNQPFFGRSPFGGGFSPIGFNAPGTTAYTGPQGFAGNTASVALNPMFTSIQGQRVYAANLGYDVSSSNSGLCDGIRDSRTGRCIICPDGFGGAGCTVAKAYVALSQTQGQVCTQSQADPSQIQAEAVQYGNANPADRAKMDVERLMRGSAVGGGGPGVAPFCPPLGPGSPMAPKHFKSLNTNFGYIQCSGERLCYNRICPACTMFNPASNNCDHIRDSLPASLALRTQLDQRCFQNSVGNSLPTQVEWYSYIRSNPIIVPEQNANPNPNAVNNPAVGNAFPGNVGFNAPYSSPFYARG